MDKAIGDYDESIRIDPRQPGVYHNRGDARYARGEYDKAIADYDEAIRLSPTYALAYYDRGHAWGQKGEYDKAIGDDSEAIRLDPKYGAAYRTRGALRFGQQNWAAAAEDFSQSHELNGKDASSVLWLATAGMRQGAREWAARLQQQAGTLSGDWPMPVVKFYLGTLTAEQLLAAAGDPAEGKQQGRACETDFFLASGS